MDTPTRASQRNIRLLAWFNFYTNFRLYAPIAILYFAQVTGSLALGGSIFAITMIAAALFELPTGIISDLVGRKRTIVLGAASAVAYSVLYALGGSYWLLALGALIEGLSRSFYSGNNDALLYDTLAEHGREAEFHAVLGRISASFQIALAVASLLGGIVATWSFAAVMWISVVPQIACLVVAFLLIEPQVLNQRSGTLAQHLRAALAQFRTNWRLRTLTLAQILDFGIGETAYQFQAAFIATLWPLWAIGVAKTLSNVFAAASFRWSGAIIDRFSAIKVLLFTSVGDRVLGALALLLSSLVSPLIMSMGSLLFGAKVVSQSTLMQREFSDTQRATMGSLGSLAGSLFSGVCAIAIGMLADRVGITGALLVTEVLRLPVIWLYWRVFQGRRQGDTVKS